MEVESNNEFQIVFSEETQSDATIPCHLSPEKSAVAMEIRWFKETSCVCFYKNRRFIEGISYEGRVSLSIKELERGNVSLQLKELEVGDYLCQVTSGDRTKEITISRSLKTCEGDFEMLPQAFWSKKIDKKWTDKERTEMANSALSAVFHSLEKEDLSKQVEEMETSEPEEKESKPENEIKRLSNQQPGCSDQKLLGNVFHSLEKDALKEDLQNINAAVLQTEKETPTEENDMQKEDLSKQVEGMETSEPEEKESKPENEIKRLSNQQPGCSDQKLLDNDVKVCIFRSGKTNNADKEFTDLLKRRILNLREVATVEESNIIFVFCPVVSRTGTDIEEALKRFIGKTDSKLAVLVVLHHTFDPEKTVPDSSKCVTRTDILTVDCLFYEDKGLLKCQKNSNAFDKVVYWLIQQGCKTGAEISHCQRPGQIQNESPRKSNKNEGESQHLGKKRPREENILSKKGVKVCSILAGKTNNCHKEFITTLGKKIENLGEVATVEESNIILVFCPIVSRTGTDIEAALNKFNYSTDSKLAVLVVLHHTFDPEKIVPDSSKCVTRTDILTVDCLFYEDTGLLKCQKNSDAFDKVVYWLIQQEGKMGVKIYLHKNSSKSFISRIFNL